MVRCFIGIKLPETIKQNIMSVQDALRKLGVNCKFVEPENLHISLSFLGEIAETDVNKITVKLGDICKRYPKCSIKIAGIKLIPNANYIRVIALDVVDDSGIIDNLSKNIKSEIGGDVKPPHLTLCRVNRPIGKGIVEKIKTIYSEAISLNTNSICLIKSELQRSGPVYTTISEIGLL